MTKKYRLLIADDFKSSADKLSLLLQMQGHEVCTAYDGPDAVAAAEEFRPNMAFLDIAMPGLSGYEACRRIREQPWGQGMLLVAMSGWIPYLEPGLAKDAGFDQILVKPIDGVVLSNLLDYLAIAAARQPRGALLDERAPAVPASGAR